MTGDMDSTLKRHLRFWNREAVERPLVGFRIGSYFPATWFRASESLLKKDRVVSPEHLDPQPFVDDYERLHVQSIELDQDLLWVAEPFMGIPWIEGIVGCRIRGAPESLWAEPWLKDWNDFPDSVDLEGNPWFQKYMAFTEMLVRVSEGRFPVGQPILRGPMDVLATMRGHARAVMDLVDSPEEARRVLRVVGETFAEVVRRQQEMLRPIHGGYSIGFYNLWAPGPVIWVQEDASALLSPGLYRDFVFPVDTQIFQPYRFTLFHLHPASFFILDVLLEMESLKVIQINKDVGGPSVPEMIPLFKRVLEHKCLMIWGDLTRGEIEAIARDMPAKGLALQMVVPDASAGKELMAVVRSQAWKN